MPDAKIEKVEVDIPLIGKKQVAKWIHKCEPGINLLIPTFQLTTDIDIELDTSKIKGMAGAIGKLLGDKDVEDMINNAKQLVPSGKAGFSLTWKPELFQQYCPGSKSRFAYMGYELKLAIVVAVAGQYGVVKGKANVAVEFEIASDFHECDCPPEEEVLIVSATEIYDSNEMLLADRPVFAGPTAANMVKLRSPRGDPESERKSTELEPQPSLSQGEQRKSQRHTEVPTTGEAIVTSTDEATGEVRVLKRFKVE